ncbi:oligoribonuclease [Bifidobacterium simiarum]|uniref:Oligoribonuclease n=1 Tax=Bifidobacterium simiarum TaxID=2045441 RepID=A0A2M9HCW5_9BIFI|nr:oligoribonuclease [Bifidobacterium simiarum]MBT1165959.1 oligoribonuclease [Bifidobacterium simiarum]PJM74655.1 oligoribonuclease [Bifidobacterium simiarum]
MASHNDKETFDPKESRLIWIDCEMTGLDIFHDELCEVSVVPTDFDLNVLDEGIDLVIKPSDAAVAHMNDFVRNMHTSSGLIDEWNANGLELDEAQRQVIEYVRQWLPKRGKAHLAGNSVGSDKKFLDRYMPDLMSLLHYRVIDVSTLKELARRWYPDVYLNKPAKHGGHRALADIIESLDELRYYRKAFFVPAPGPDAAGAKAIAADIEATSLLRTYEENGNPVEDPNKAEKADY